MIDFAQLETRAIKFVVEYVAAYSVKGGGK
jgi:hypothetical protein